LLELAADLEKAKYAGVPVLNDLSDEFAFGSLCQPNARLRRSEMGKEKIEPEPIEH
jgi:hypothetical protein